VEGANDATDNFVTVIHTVITLYGGIT